MRIVLRTLLAIVVAACAAGCQQDHADERLVRGMPATEAFDLLQRHGIPVHLDHSVAPQPGGSRQVYRIETAARPDAIFLWMGGVPCRVEFMCHYANWRGDDNSSKFRPDSVPHPLGAVGVESLALWVSQGIWLPDQVAEE